MKTLSYVLSSEEEVLKGNKYYFGQLWDGNGDGEELLQSGEISLYGNDVVSFKITKENEDLLKTLVEVIEIY